jgi:NADPH-dependent glutamate synthase beta subunit-like oxidoreductase
MYEKSNKPGGLLVDGIPAHKFDKTYLAEDFARLQAMGLELHLQSEVVYDEQTREYRIKGDDKSKAIASSDNEDQFIALCIGAGKPKDLPQAVLSDLKTPGRKKIIQAMDFLQAANDVAHALKMKPSVTAQEKETMIRCHFGDMDPRRKKIVVIGGGDTAQDVIRWIARYLNQDADDSLGELNILVRGPQVSRRAVLDGYPSVSRAPTHENELKREEVEYIQGTETYLVEPVKVTANAENGKLKLQIKESKFKCASQIQSDPQLKELFEALPREMRAIESSVSREIDDVDLIVCALGFQGNDHLPLVESIEKHQLKNVYLAGDAAGTGIIVAAQSNADKMYGQIRSAMGIATAKLSSAFNFFSGQSATSGTGRKETVIDTLSNSFF